MVASPTSTFIHRLSDDSLSIIFHLVISKVKEAYAVSAVCTKWRALAQSRPLLWTCLPTVTMATTREATRAILSLSQGQPLTVTCRCKDPSKLPPALPTIFHRLSRIRKLTLIMEHKLILSKICHLLNDIGSKLATDITVDYLEISYALYKRPAPGSFDYWDMPLLTCPMPSLRVLKIQNCVLDPQSVVFSSSIEHMEISLQPLFGIKRWSWEQWLNILSKLHSLNTLSTTASLTSPSGEASFLSGVKRHSSLRIIHLQAELVFNYSPFLRMIETEYLDQLYFSDLIGQNNSEMYTTDLIPNISSFLSRKMSGSRTRLVTVHITKEWTQPDEQRRLKCHLFVDDPDATSQYIFGCGARQEYLEPMKPLVEVMNPTLIAPIDKEDIEVVDALLRMFPHAKRHELLIMSCRNIPSNVF